MDLKECFCAAGGDYEDMMRRFSGEDRVDRFLGMFLQDPNFATLRSAMEAGNWGEAFRAVHTMKGLCMNLSLTVLANSCAALSENLRGGQADGHTDSYFQTIEADYQRTAAAIRAHLQM